MEQRTENWFIQELKEKRLLDLYNALRRTGAYASLVDICRELEVMPQPIHYISYLHARIAYKRFFLERKPVHHKHISKDVLYNSFLNECKKLRSLGLTDADTVIKKALLCQAPCIGISEPQIRRILRRQGCK